MPREYSQKAALVTGGARGIGLASALLLAERGYRVAIADRDRAAGRKTAAEAGLAFIRCDVAREADVRACVRQVLRRYGRLDALVNNAGIAEPATGPLEKLRLAEWNRRIGANLSGMFLMAKHAAAHLRRTRGAMVNIASTRALQSEPDTEAYAASKGGVVALTHALALSLGPEVRVNCVSPGWIDTGKAKLSRRDHLQHPVGRVGRPADVAELVAFLLSNAAGFATGQNYVLDGGMTRKMIYL
ncbi:MAG TPA: SDR family oxidoreductase [Burkholderiales bacterium]|jgi:NAD(P)-dependent dehydrogenase (short-subunit alcohol dehydrogenase family)|nr:SDR family oxidoreductase [Burkholderiales bacterium]